MQGEILGYDDNIGEGTIKGVDGTAINSNEKTGKRAPHLRKVWQSISM